MHDVVGGQEKMVLFELGSIRTKKKSGIWGSPLPQHQHVIIDMLHFKQRAESIWRSRKVCFCAVDHSPSILASTSRRESRLLDSGK
jgi:hypothetical protein